MIGVFVKGCFGQKDIADGRCCEEVKGEDGPLEATERPDKATLLIS